MKITVIGTGYVGLSNAILLAQQNEVYAVDIVKENKSDVMNTITLEELINSNKNEFIESSLKFYNFVNQAIIDGVEKNKKLCESDRAKFLSIILTILYGNYIPNTDSNIDNRYNDVLKFIKTGGVVNDD